MNTEYVQNEASAKIAALNDAARKNARSYTATLGIMSLEPRMISDIFVAVQEFNSFTEDNDPYGEHDFGVVEIANDKIFWKIDYYNKDLSGGCDSLSNECRRVITIMLADEY